MDHQEEFCFQQPASCFVDTDFDMYSNHDENSNLFNAQFFANNQNNLNGKNATQYRSKFQESDYFESGNDCFNNQAINPNEHQDNQFIGYEDPKYDQLQNTFDFNTNINSSQTESFINPTNDQEVRENIQTPQVAHQKMPIKEKVKLRKQKIQLLKGLKVEQNPKQQKEEIEQEQNQQESQSTDIEKMVEESQDKESSNSTESIKKISKKINKKKDKESAKAAAAAAQSDDEPQDKRSQQKIKNRISAQKSRDEKKKQMICLTKEVDDLKKQINTLESENKLLKNQLLNQQSYCSKCSSQMSPSISSPSTDDSENYFNDIKEEYYTRPSNSYYRGAINMSSMNLAILLVCCCLIGVSVYENNMPIQNYAIGFNQMQAPTGASQGVQGNLMKSSSICESNEKEGQHHHSLKVYEDYGIDVNSLQLQSTLVDTKLINNFAQPTELSSELAELIDENQQRDQILCPKATVIVSEKDNINSKYTLVDVAINMNQTQYLQQVEGKLIPVFNSGGRGIQILTCVVAKSEITSLQTELLN